LDEFWTVARHDALSTCPPDGVQRLRTSRSLIPQISVPGNTQERPDPGWAERATKQTLSNWHRSCRQKGRRFGAHRPYTKPRGPSRSC